MGTNYIHPSMAKVTELSEAFLKKAHKIMRDKGYKLTSGVQSAAADWTYEKAGSPTVWMSGWHGRKPREWGAGKTVWDINVESSSKSEYTTGADFEMLSCSDIILGPRRENQLPDAIVFKYEENLKKALEFLQKDLEAYIVMVTMIS